MLSLRTVILLTIVAVSALVALFCLLITLLTTIQTVRDVGGSIARSMSLSTSQAVELFFHTEGSAPMKSMHDAIRASHFRTPADINAANGGDTTAWRKHFTALVMSIYAVVDYRPLGLFLGFVGSSRQWLVASKLESGDSYFVDTVDGAPHLNVSGVSWRVDPRTRQVVPLSYPVPATETRVPRQYRDLQSLHPAYFTVNPSYAECVDRIAVFLYDKTYQALNASLVSAFICPIKDATGAVRVMPWVTHTLFSVVSELLLLRRSTRNAHNFLVDRDGYLLATTVKDLVWASAYTVPYRDYVNLPPGCSNSAAVDAGKPFQLGCRLAPWSWNFTYGPLRQVARGSREVINTSTYASVDVDVDGERYYVASHRFATVFGIQYNVISVLPESDVLPQAELARAIGLSIGLTALVVALLSIGVWWVLAEFVLGNLEELTAEMLMAAEMKDFTGADSGTNATTNTNASTTNPGGEERGGGASHRSRPRVHNVSGGSSGRTSHDGGSSRTSLNSGDEQGLSALFSAIVDKDDVADLDLNRDADDAFAEPRGDSARRQGRGAGGAQPSAAVAADAPATAEASASPATGDGRRRSVITEIAAVEKAYRTAIDNLRKMASHVPSKALVAADIVLGQQQRQHEEDARRERGAAAVPLPLLSARHSIPVSARRVSILLVELDQISSIDAGRVDRNQVSTLLYTYYRRLNRCIVAHGGIVHQTAAPVGDSRAALMAVWGTAPLDVVGGGADAQGGDECAIMATLCALCVDRECARQDMLVKRFNQVLGEPPKLRMAVATGVAQVGCIETAEQVRHLLLGEVCSRSVVLLAAARRWEVRGAGVCDTETASAVDLVVKLRLLCLHKFRTKIGPCFVHAIAGLDTGGDAMQSIVRGVDAQDAMALALRLRLRRQISLANRAAGNDDDDDGNASSQQQQQQHGRGGDVASERSGATAMSQQQQKLRQQQQLSEAFTLGTIDEVRTRHPQLAEVLAPSRINLNVLLRWHAQRTAVEPGEERFAELFTRAAKFVLSCSFAECMRVMEQIRIDAALSPALRAHHGGSIARMELIARTFDGQAVHPRNLIGNMFCELVRGNGIVPTLDPFGGDGADISDVHAASGVLSHRRGGGEDLLLRDAAGGGGDGEYE